MNEPIKPVSLKSYKKTTHDNITFTQLINRLTEIGQDRVKMFVVGFHGGDIIHLYCILLELYYVRNNS